MTVSVLPAQLQDISVTNGSDKKMQTDNLTELYRNISSLQEERRLAERPARIAEAVRIPANEADHRTEVFAYH